MVQEGKKVFKISEYQLIAYQLIGCLFLSQFSLDAIYLSSGIGCFTTEIMLFLHYLHD